MRRGARWMMVLGIVMGATGEAEAQGSYGPGGALYVNFVVSDAIGDFGYAVDQGYGMEIGAGLPIAAEGHLRMRFDGGFSIYGLERIQYCDYGCRVGSTVTTTNSVFYAGAGPEMVFGSGKIRPYVHGSAGAAWFVTSSHVDEDLVYGTPYLDTTNYWDWGFAWRAGGGLRFGVGDGPVFIDLGATLHNNPVTSYLTNGDIVDNSDGTVTMHPNLSDTDMVSFKMGVAIAIH